MKWHTIKSWFLRCWSRKSELSKSMSYLYKKQWVSIKRQARVAGVPEHVQHWHHFLSVWRTDVWTTVYSVELHYRPSKWLKWTWKETQETTTLLHLFGLHVVCKSYTMKSEAYFLIHSRSSHCRRSAMPQILTNAPPKRAFCTSA